MSGAALLIVLAVIAGVSALLVAVTLWARRLDRQVAVIVTEMASIKTDLKNQREMTTMLIRSQLKND